MRALSLLLLLSVLTILIPVGSAEAQSPSLSVSPLSGPPGTLITFSGRGFTPQSKVEVYLAPGIERLAARAFSDQQGLITGSFVAPDPITFIPEIGSGPFAVFAIDMASGQQTQTVSFQPVAPGPDFDLPNGHFYTQANGQPLGTSDKGYAIVDSQPFAYEVRFWSEFKLLGGVPALGYPASRRFVWDEFVSQVVQKGVLQWRPELNTFQMVNIFDEMSKKGLDESLLATRAVPKPLDFPEDAGLPFSEVISRHQQLLDANPAIKSQYFSVPDPLLIYGLPMSRVEDMGSHFAIRLQRAVIQQWKEAVPWANAGQVTVANGGDIAKETGFISSIAPFAAVPQNRPLWSTDIVVYEPSPGDTVTRNFQVTGDARVFEAVVSFDLLNASGQKIAGGSTMARSGAPTFAAFYLTVDYQISGAQTGTLRLFATSPADGSIVPQSIVSIPLTLTP